MGDSYMTSNTQKLYKLGQSIWYDNIERRLLNSGEMADMIKREEIFGVTSNPSIFNNAIANSKDYDSALAPLAKSGKTSIEIYESLAVEDIREAADLFRPVYEDSRGLDGYVSLEVNPDLAHDTKATCDDAIRLWNLVNRPNLMIKIPATKAGLPAIEYSITEGINVNVTLIFSLQRYEEVMSSYLTGLENRIANGNSVKDTSSVASFFVSRIDTKVDERLNEIAGLEEVLVEIGSPGEIAVSLIGKIAVANAVLAYQRFQKVFNNQRFRDLQAKGANIQRPLWASTSTKNPAYPDTKYIDELIGPDTINTVPPKTLIAYKDHGLVENTLERDLDSAQDALSKLESVGISMDQATQELEDEGVNAFSQSFHGLIDSIERRRLSVLS
jgi:transaldolase